MDGRLHLGRVVEKQVENVMAFVLVSADDAGIDRRPGAGIEQRYARVSSMGQTLTVQLDKL